MDKPKPLRVAAYALTLDGDSILLCRLPNTEYGE